MTGPLPRWETPPTPAPAGPTKLKPVWPFVLVLFLTVPAVDVVVRIAYVAGIYRGSFGHAFGYVLTAVGVLFTIGAAVGWVVVERSNKRVRAASATAQRAPAWHGVVAAVITIPLYLLGYPLFAILLNAVTPGLSARFRWQYFFDFSNTGPIYLALWLLQIAATIAAGVSVAIIRGGTNPAPRQAINAPIAYTPEGQPVYPIVGYTPDGTPVTADRAVGLQSSAPLGTNGMAIVALITGLTFAPLGIIFGHIALSQIKRTGQEGHGMAIAGLVLGYLGLIPLIGLAVLLVAANGNF